MIVTPAAPEQIVPPPVTLNAVGAGIKVTIALPDIARAHPVDAFVANTV